MRAAQFCGSCGRVQQPSGSDYFAFFGLPRKLTIDLKKLESDFHELSRHLHPDLNARFSEQEQAWSLQMTSMLNDAYRTLRDPIERTAYLLKKEGVNIEEQSKRATEQARSAGGLKKQAVPPELLEEVFELNMLLEEARDARNAGEAEAMEDELLATLANWKQRKIETLAELNAAWAEWDKLADERGTLDFEHRQALLKRMTELINRQAYVRNALRDVNEVLDLG